MRGESIIHAFVMLCFGLLALGISVDYNNYVLLYRDFVLGIFVSCMMMVICTAIFTMKESENYYEKSKVRYLEDIPMLVLVVRIFVILFLLFPATIVWNIGITVDGIFIYLLLVWGYCISLISLTIAETVFNYKGKDII